MAATMKISSVSTLLLVFLAGACRLAGGAFILPGASKATSGTRAQVLLDEDMAIQAIDFSILNGSRETCFGLHLMTDAHYVSFISFFLALESGDSAQALYPAYTHGLPNTYSRADNLIRTLSIGGDNSNGGLYHLVHQNLRLARIDEVHGAVRQALTANNGSMDTIDSIIDYIQTKLGLFIPKQWVKAVFVKIPKRKKTAMAGRAGFGTPLFSRMQSTARQQMAPPLFTSEERKEYAKSLVRAHEADKEAYRKVRESEQENLKVLGDTLKALIQQGKDIEASHNEHRKALESSNKEHRKAIESNYNEHRKALESNNNEHRKALENFRKTLESNNNEQRKTLDNFRKTVESSASKTREFHQSTLSDALEREASFRDLLSPQALFEPDSDNDSDSDSSPSTAEPSESDSKPAAKPTAEPAGKKFKSNDSDNQDDSDSDSSPSTAEPSESDSKPAAKPTAEPAGKKFKSNDSDDQAEAEYKHCRTFMQNMSKAVEEDEEEDPEILAAEQEIHPCSECGAPIVGGGWCDVPNCNGARALPPGGFQGWGGTPLGKKMEQEKWQCPDCLCRWPMTAKACEFSECESNKNETKASPVPSANGFTFQAPPSGTSNNANPTPSPQNFQSGAPSSGSGSTGFGGSLPTGGFFSQPPTAPLAPMVGGFFSTSGPASFPFGADPNSSFDFGIAGANTTNAEEVEESSVPAVASAPPFTAFTESLAEEMVTGDFVMVHDETGTFQGMTRRGLRVRFPNGTIITIQHPFSSDVKVRKWPH